MQTSRSSRSANALVIWSVVLNAAIWPHSSFAEDLPADCLKSFQVQPDKVVIHYGWLPGGSSFITPMYCLEAESLRERLFLPDATDAIGNADIDAALSDQDPLASVLKQLQDSKAGFIAQNTPSALRIWLDTQLWAIAKTQVLYSCLTIETGVGAGLCALGVIPLIVSSYDLYYKLQQGSGSDSDTQDVLAKFDRSINQVQQLIASGDYHRTQASVAQSLLRDAQVGLCREIQQSCIGQ
jgi:hypothetical protein